MRISLAVHPERAAPGRSHGPSVERSDGALLCGARVPNDSTEGLPQPDIEFWYRTAFGGTALELTKLYPCPAPVPHDPAGGQHVQPGVSTDGVHFTLIPGSTVDIDMPATTLDGLAVDSGSSSNTGTATFTTLAVGTPVTTTMTPQAPTDPCPQRLDVHRRGQPQSAR